MYTSVRKPLGLILGVLALLGPLSAKGQAQTFRPVGPLPITGINLNPFVNPLAASNLANAATLGSVFNGRAALATAGFQHPLAALSGYGFGLHQGAGLGALAGMKFAGHLGAFAGFNLGARYGAFASPYAQMGYASLLNGGAGGGWGGGGFGGGGYGMLGATALSGAALGAGMSYGAGMFMTQWMMNPYEGYLKGAADITRANAEYYQTIQQAKLTRQAVRRSSLETRRAMIEEAEWERERMPDPEKIRQKELERELDHARVSPPPNDIWSARAPNALLRHLITRQGEGTPGPNVPLGEDIRKHINVSAGNTRGNVGLIKSGGELDWPESLMGGEFKEKRERLNSLMKDAYKSVSSDNNPSDATLNDLQDNFRDMQKILEGNVAKFSPNLYIEAKRYLGEVKDAIAALKDPNVGNQFNNNWTVKATNVAELVRDMREKGLRFDPATERDRPAYMALYHALAAFDAGLPPATSGNSDNANNK